jgi:hypothetical protein
MIPLLLIPLAAYAQAPAAPRATVTLSPMNERTVTVNNVEMVQRDCIGRFQFGPREYAIQYRVRQDKTTGKIDVIEGAVGMPLPCSCNWYHSGFLFLYLNGQDIALRPLSSMMVAESGDRAILDMVWHHELANVRLRFVGLPDHDCLFCEITLEPKQEIKSLSLTLRCYPSFFTSFYKRVGARRIQTPTALVEENKRQKFAPADGWWALYYDEVFDVAKGEGEGPCAMLLLPDQPTEISYEPGGYAVNTVITYPPSTRTLRLAFWDFKGETNAAALARLKETADQVRGQLQTLDFTPQAVRDFDLAGLRTEVERALQSDAVRKALGAKLDEVQEWVRQVEPALQAEGGANAVEAQERLLQAQAKYRDFIWEIRLAELLKDL